MQRLALMHVPCHAGLVGKLRAEFSAGTKCHAGMGENYFSHFSRAYWFTASQSRNEAELVHAASASSAVMRRPRQCDFG